MAVEPSPAFSFYVRDWLSDAKVRAMTNEARGVYIDLLAFCWQEGTLPGDAAQLARIARLTPREFQRIWPQVQPCFSRIAEGWRQKRLDRERAVQHAHRAAAAQRGNKGAAARWSKHGPSIAQGLLGDDSASASAEEQEQEEEEQRLTPPSHPVDPCGKPPEPEAAEPVNPRVLARLCYELGLEDCETWADAAEALKCLASRYRVPYTGPAITRALTKVAYARATSPLAPLVRARGT